jgi:hypothetical protein
MATHSAEPPSWASNSRPMRRKQAYEGPERRLADRRATRREGRDRRASRRPAIRLVHIGTPRAPEPVRWSRRTKWIVAMIALTMLALVIIDRL